MDVWRRNTYASTTKSRRPYPWDFWRFHGYRPHFPDGGVVHYITARYNSGGSTRVAWRNTTIAAVLAIALGGADAAHGSGADSTRVHVSGAHRIPDDVARELANGRDGAQRLADEYARRGYWTAVIVATSDSARKIRRLDVDEGPPVTLTIARPPGVSGSGHQLGGPADVPDWIEGALRREAHRGHPFASIEIASAMEPARGEFALDVRLDRGPRVEIGGVLALGNTITRDDVIRRELRRGDTWTYDQRVVDRWVRSLRRTGYFEHVGEPGLSWSDSTAGLADLVISVSEGRPSRFEGVVGYQPASQAGTAGGGGGAFTGLVDLVLGNLWGSGRRIAARWERPVAETTTLDLAYCEPWVGGVPIDAEARLAVEQRPGYAVEQMEMHVSGELWPGLIVGGSVGRDIARSDSIPLLGGPRYRGYLLSGELDYDTRDHQLNPSAGLYYRLLWRASFRENQVNDDDFVDWSGAEGWPRNERTSVVRVDLEHFVGIGERVVAAIGWHGAQVTSDGVDDALSDVDQLRMGGVGSVRGYQQDQFSGDLSAWGTHELRYRLGVESRAFAFIDAGAVRSRRRDPLGGTVTTTAWPVGYGVGLRARTGAGVLGIDFGWGRRDSFGQGKVHVRLETLF